MQPTLDDFLPTRGSRIALRAVRKLVAAKRGAPRLLVLSGPPGVGKTHLLRAAAAEVRSLHPAWTIREATASDLVRQLLEAGANDTARSGLLTVDDLHVLAGMPRTQVEVVRRFERRLRSGGLVLAGAGVPMADLPDLAHGLRRIKGAELVELPPPSTHEMTQLLLTLAATARVDLDGHRARLLAARCRGDVRLAQGAIARLRFAATSALR